MITKDQKGFSLIELVCVVAIIGIIASLAIPAVLKAKVAAENGTAFATMRSINSTQANFFAQNGRFGRLSEINAMMANGIGENSGNQIIRGKYFIFEMDPSDPTDTDLKDGFKILAKRGYVDSALYEYGMDERGNIEQIYP